MGTPSSRWDRAAVLARLEAIAAIDESRRPLAERARRRLEVLRVVDAVDRGVLTAAEAADVLRSIASEILDPVARAA